jgi:hypothetical protein
MVVAPHRQVVVHRSCRSMWSKLPVLSTTQQFLFSILITWVATRPPQSWRICLFNRLTPIRQSVRNPFYLNMGDTSEIVWPYLLYVIPFRAHTNPIRPIVLTATGSERYGAGLAIRRAIASHLRCGVSFGFGAEVAGRAAMNLSRSCYASNVCRRSHKGSYDLHSADFSTTAVRLGRTARARVDPTAERSMQPLRRFYLLGLRADSKAFARRRKRPGTERAALVHCVPAALDPTNVGLHVVDVVRNEIIHRDHLTSQSRRASYI